MNSLGRKFRVSVFGESHGPAIGLLIDGCPAGVPFTEADLQEDLDRRRGGLNPGTTPRKEKDQPQFISGIWNGHSTGAPLAILFQNENILSKDYDFVQQTPRPGHADWVGNVKYGGFQDYRGSGHFSGRLTLSLVAAGVLAKKILKISFPQIETHSTILEVAGERDIDTGIDKAVKNNDSVGGIVECVVTGLPAGIGEPFFDSLESMLSHAVFSIPAVKGIEFGNGFAAAKMFGSENNDAIMNADGLTATNHAGGIVGGISNGNDLLFRVAIKPPSSTPKEQQSFNFSTGLVEALTIGGRHDLCIALRVPVVLEAVTAIVITDLLMISGKIPDIIQ